MHVDPQHAAEHVRRVLGMIVLISTSSPIAQGNVEKTVRAESQHAAVVIRVRLRHFPE